MAAFAKAATVKAEADKAAAEKAAAEKATTDSGPHVYDFVVSEATANSAGLHITDIRVDGVRVSDDQLEIKAKPNYLCDSKSGGFQCISGKIAVNDPEPSYPSYTDLTWTKWDRTAAPVGKTVFTITTTKKVTRFEIDSFRPKYVAGWKIMENGVQVLQTSKGENADGPNPSTVEYVVAARAAAP